MATKTFKIGEYAVGGIIRVNTNGTDIEVRAIDWDTNDVLAVHKVDTRKMDARYDLVELLDSLTSYYYSQQILSWIEGKAGVVFKTEFTY